MTALRNLPKVCVLLGSGASIPAELPSVQQITDRVLSGEGFWRWSNGAFRTKRSGGDLERHVPLITRFLYLLIPEIERYYGIDSSRGISYEDLHYLSGQISDALTGEYDNPAVQPLIDKILPKVDKLLGHKTPDDVRDLKSLAGYAGTYIEDVAWSLLAKAPVRTDYLSWLKPMVEELGTFDVITTNQDKLLEAYFAADKISFVDGFERGNEGFPRWVPDLLARPVSNGVRLFKVHGSINWFRVSAEREQPIETAAWGSRGAGEGRRGALPGRHVLKAFIAKLEGEDWKKVEVLRDGVQHDEDEHPEILCGTFNKMLRYLSGIFADLHWHYRTALKACDRLVVCGYGFSDKGVNFPIVAWFRYDQGKRIVVVDPAAGMTDFPSRGGPPWLFELGRKEGRIKEIPKRVEELTWAELRGSLGLEKV